MTTTADEEVLRNCEGMYVGMLSEEEMEAFERLVRLGRASRDYGEGVMAMMGLAKVKLHGN